jgi:hypothetical protein
MQLGETIATYDVALALRGESGKFDVTSPTGEIFHVTCNPNHSISNLEWSGNKAGAQPFLIRKVAEPVSAEQAKASITSTGETPSQTAPFLLDTGVGVKLPTRKGPPSVPQPEGLDSAEIVGFELLYLECDPKTQRPVASIRLKGGSDYASPAEQSITSPCVSLNELDAEIRRLHAELDEIRSQARKKFYQTHTIAARA